MRVAFVLGWTFFLISICVVGQERKREIQVLPPPVYSQLAQPIPQRYTKLFKADFAKLNLAGTSSGYGENHSKRIVEHFNSGNEISFLLSITNASEEEVVGWSELDSHILNRPQLYRDEELVPYRENVKKLLQAKDRVVPNGRSNSFLLESKTSITERISLDDWYEPLKPGSYELSVWRRFIWGGEWVESPSLKFEVVVPVKSEGPLTDVDRTDAGLAMNMKSKAAPKGGLFVVSAKCAGELFCRRCGWLIAQGV